MRARTHTVFCVLLSTFLIQHVASDFECFVQDFHNYTDTIKGCDDKKSLTFNVSLWSRPPKDLINRTQNIQTIDVSNQSLHSIDNKEFCNWSHLRFINAERNNVSSLSSSFLVDCHLLDTLSLNRNHINEMYDDAFHGLTLLTTLDLSNNQLFKLSGDVFKPLTALKSLRLDNNYIQAIDYDHFQYNKKLEILHLSYNQIQVIQQRSFWNLKKLDTLDVSFNPDLNTLDLSEMDRLHDVYVESASLTRLHIPNYVDKVVANNNKITHLTIEPNGVLEELYLRNNSFHNVSELSVAVQLNTLDISYNNITDIDFSYLMSTEIKQLIVLENPIKNFNVIGLTTLPSIRSIEITTSNLDNQTLTDLIHETQQRKIILRDPNRDQERKNIVTMPPVTPVPENEAKAVIAKMTTAIPITTLKPNVKPVPTSAQNQPKPASNDSKDEVFNDLLKRIKALETEIKVKQSISPDEHHEMAESIANLRVLVICTIVAFSIFISCHLAMFVTKRWAIPLPNLFTNRHNGLSNSRRSRILTDSMDPIMEEVL